MKKLLLLVVAAAFAYLVHLHDGAKPTDTPVQDAVVSQDRTATGQVSGAGTVIRILPDDDDGDRHQRFLLRLQSGATLLVAHNIDIAPRVEPLHEGDIVEYQGEFAWNPKGGVVHWTHHDPEGHHPSGWLRHDGRTFQ
jgi:hypothetical protein